jgi:hypothetical protein
MPSVAQTVASLVARRTQLVRELTNVDNELNAISQALGAVATRQAAESGSAAAAPVPSTARPTQKKAAEKKAARKVTAKEPAAKRAWLEKDEAAKLMRRIARTPKPAAEVVREMAKLKGYEGRLSAEDMHRLQGAAFMAVAQAVKGKSLKRHTNGSVVGA